MWTRRIWNRLHGHDEEGRHSHFPVVKPCTKPPSEEALLVEKGNNKSKIKPTPASAEEKQGLLDGQSFPRYNGPK